MKMEAPKLMTYGANNASAEATECPIASCRMRTDSKGALTKHILFKHPLVRTKWRCSCGDEGFENKMAIDRNVKKMLGRGQTSVETKVPTEVDERDTYRETGTTGRVNDVPGKGR